ncbi:hypothetical protein Rhow_007820 [Rhodococcus wratislaviensis]|uniref:Uncharacterized protein n=1 Tax=Rhodococcus wratislaviensis TaxID=44752 RepID=A0A402CIW1_RHOWR|nr:hypothetical protein Rhow_007820 [Rhodococcus wratislaviensis]
MRMQRPACGGGYTYRAMVADVHPANHPAKNRRTGERDSGRVVPMIDHTMAHAMPHPML